MGRLFDSPVMLLILLVVLVIIPAVVITVIVLAVRNSRNRNPQMPYGPPGTWQHQGPPPGWHQMPQQGGTLGPNTSDQSPPQSEQRS